MIGWRPSAARFGEIWICILLLTLCLLAGASGRGHAATVLDRAAVQVELQGAAPAWFADVPLPYNWNFQHGDSDGRARFSFAFPVRDTETPHAIYLPRIGNTFEISVNGVLIERMGSPGNRYEDFAKQPRYVRIPSGILRQRNTLEISIDAQGGRKGGLSQVLVGPRAELDPAHRFNHFWQTTGLLAVAIVSFVLGAFAFLLWLRQRDVLYLYYACAEFLWMLYLGDSLSETSPLPWPWWGIVVYSVQTTGALLIFKFSLLAIGRHEGWLKRLLNWNLLLTPPFVMFSFFAGLPWGEQFWKFVTDTLSLCVIVTVVRHGILHKELEKRVLAVGMLLLAMIGIRDELVLVILPYTNFMTGGRIDLFEQFAWSRYAWVLFGLSLAWIIAERMRKSTQEIAAMNQTLSRRLAERENELHAAFALQARSERQQAMIEERQRLMRDMHDGLGSQLVGALQLALNPAVSKDALAGQLRETLDHLKMTVDAMQDTQGDIAALLGALRYRLNPRLAAAGVRLDWAVELLPEIADWTLPKSRDVQMILFEAFSNLIVHAGARHAELRAGEDTERHAIRIVLRDDGRGFDAAVQAGGHGLANMRARAARLSAELLIDSSPAGTAITLLLPLEQAGTPA
ncbi:MAG TPA: ATP-binding protein [Paucimonas sp.]|nr:ATP-binding protein [Paucimonas sp.]